MSTSKSNERPLSPFMIGPYYRAQFTTVLSFSHRVTGFVLSVVTAPLLVCLAVALATGDEAWAAVTGWLGSGIGLVAALISVLCLWYHTLNGLRHLLWDTGRALDIPGAIATGWVVAIGTLVLTALTVIGVMGGAR